MYQRSVDTLIPRAPFMRLVRELSQDVSPGIRYTRAAIDALQEASEAHLVKMFEDDSDIATHNGRVTVLPRDEKLRQKIASKPVL